MKKNIILFSCLFLVFASTAQQEPAFSQYFLNPFVVNPAATNSENAKSLSIQTRQQWLGFENAPLVSNISYYQFLNNRSSLGGILIYDKAYPSTNAELQLNYSYRVPLDYDFSFLSFGIGAKATYYNLDFNIQDLPTANDNALKANSYDKILADASFGIYLYSDDYFAGFSSSNLLESSFKTSIPSSPYSNSEFRTYSAVGGYKLNVFNNDWYFEPSFLYRKTKYQSSTTDFTTRIIYLDNQWLALGYRTNGTAVMSLGFTTNKFRISYSYDHSFSSVLTQYSLGTHELMLVFGLKN